MSNTNMTLDITLDNKLCYSQAWDTVHVSSPGLFLYWDEYPCASQTTHSQQFCLFPQYVKCLFKNSYGIGTCDFIRTTHYFISQVLLQTFFAENTLTLLNPGRCLEDIFHHAYFAKYQTFLSHFFIKTCRASGMFLKVPRYKYISTNVYLLKYFEGYVPCCSGFRNVFLWDVDGI